MIPVFVLEGKFRICVEISGFIHPSYDEVQVVDDVLIVTV